MIEITKTTNKNLFIEGIRIAFENDNDLILFHNKPSSNIEEMVQETYFNIGIFRGELGADLYLVYLNKKLIGFTCIGTKLSILYSFGINIEYRTENNLENWLNIVQSILFERTGFINVLLNSKNIRAIKFFEKKN
jgi:hypothetical protein